MVFQLFWPLHLIGVAELEAALKSAVQSDGIFRVNWIWRKSGQSKAGIPVRSNPTVIDPAHDGSFHSGLTPDIWETKNVTGMRLGADR